MIKVVAKFGGTSMGSVEAISKVAEIVMGGGMADDGTGVSGNVSRRIVAVVSATSGTTDKLIALGEAALKGSFIPGNGTERKTDSPFSWEDILNSIIEKHEKIIADLGLNLNFQNFCDEMKKLAQGINLLGELSLSARDKLMSFGERISSQILAVLLNLRGVKAVAVDAYELVFTDNNFGEGNIDFEKTNAAMVEKIGALLRDGIVPVITGFIGQSADGHYITLGRGGSDYSGAIVAGALGASELQIWTDVDGIFNTDPRLVPSAKVLPRVSFNEAGELAYFGAKVLHPKTIKPAIEKNIPVKILNTFNPTAVGTLITNEEEESLKSVTYKKNISIVNICSAGMLEARGFLAKIFEVFKRYGVDVDVVSTSEVSVSVTVDNGEADRVVQELSEFATVNVEKGMAIVCLVGGGIVSNKAVLGELFSAVSEHDVRMVSQGASKRNITFLVKEAEAPDVVKKIFNKFFI